MLNKLTALIRKYAMVQPGDCVICAVSGGPDSMALLWAMYMLQDKLKIRLSAAHFNHCLRGEESDRDEAFVREFCKGYGIPLAVERKQVRAGKKGLEAAARQARYDFFATLSGLVATAHTADDNAETVLMHLVRGTGLKGLGGIAPVSGRIIRPMLEVTRAQVIAFLEQYHVPYVTDSTNAEDAFLRNRLRHHVMPLLEQENPKLSQNLSAMAMQLRNDEALLESMTPQTDRIDLLRQMDVASRSRALAAFLEKAGVREPEREHILLAERLVFSDMPSAKASFPNGVTVRCNYDRLIACSDTQPIEQQELPVSGRVILENLGVTVRCKPAENTASDTDSFTVLPRGKIVVRPRQQGDSMRLSGGTKTLKKLFIDRKIPAHRRQQIPVIADDAGVLGVYGIGPNLDRVSTSADGVTIYFESIEKTEDSQ